MSTLQRAIEIAVEAHRGQSGRGGEPYILHPLRLMLQMTTEATRMVAVLHDVVEDNREWTLERLRAEGFARAIVEAVDALTRREGEAYLEFARRAGAHPLSRPVKLADLRDNMDMTRLPLLAARDHERLERYHAAWRLLSGEAPRDAASTGAAE